MFPRDLCSTPYHDQTTGKQNHNSAAWNSFSKHKKKCMPSRADSSRTRIFARFSFSRVDWSLRCFEFFWRANFRPIRDKISFSVVLRHQMECYIILRCICITVIKKLLQFPETYFGYVSSCERRSYFSFLCWHVNVTVISRRETCFLARIEFWHYKTQR